MKVILPFLCLLFISTFTFSQNLESDSLSKQKIKDLSFIVGDWKGNGWIKNQHGKSEFDQWEIVQFRLDSTAILIEGLGKMGGKTIHEALAIVTYNKEADNYNFTSFLKNGISNTFRAEIIDHKLYWYPNENMRYVIWKNENGQWFEEGEYKQEEKWFKFFEMTLDRTD